MLQQVTPSPPHPQDGVLPLPLVGVPTVETLRSQNITLKIELSDKENQILQLRHALNLALTKGASWGGFRQRVSLTKKLNYSPEALWQQTTSPKALAVTTSDSASTATAELEGVVAALQQQLQSKSSELCEVQSQLASLREVNAKQQKEIDDMKAASRSAADSGKSPAATAHLMNQITFLHEEAERLENELRDVREKAAEQLRAANESHAEDARARMDDVERLTKENNLLRAQVAPLTRRVGKLNQGEDLFARCRILEGQLATAISEKTAAVVEKHDLLTRMRKLETQIKGSKTTIKETERAAAEESAAADEQVRGLQDVIHALTQDREQIKAELAAFQSRAAIPRQSVQAQCERTETTSTSVQAVPEAVAVAHCGCQVDSIVHFAHVGDTAQSLAVTLETKCGELDSARADLDSLSSVHAETLSYLESAKARLAEELSRRKALEADLEKLQMQSRAQQQQCSQLAALLRDRDAALAAGQQRMQQAINAAAALEQDRHHWEEDMACNTSDLQKLAATQALTTEQLAQAASENDALRGEVQRLLQREAQCNYELKAKDAELGELLAAYQQSVRELDKVSNFQQTIEREADNLRATLASREERIASLQSQVSALHEREQQLAVDVQARDYENGQLHRKRVQAEKDLAQFDAMLADFQQRNEALQRVNYEFERSAVELHKQLAIKDNENMFLRNRCESVEQELSAVQTQQQIERQRLRELEDNNAHLVLQGVLQQSQAMERASRPTSACGINVSSSDVGTSIEAERARCARMERSLAEEREKRANLEASQEKLQKLVLEQAEALSQLAQ